MAFSGRAVSVATTATRIDTAAEDISLDRKSGIAVYNNGAAIVYLGGSGVTTAAGFPLAVGGQVSMDADAAEGLYGIVASGTVEVRVLEVGV